MLQDLQMNLVEHKRFICAALLYRLTIVITGFCVMKICPNKETFYTKYGSNTMNVYLLHALVVLPFIYLVFPSFGEATWFEKIALIIIPTICCLPLFSI